MNVEICNHSRSLKYLFKYCLKGNDRATMAAVRNRKQSKQRTVDACNESSDGKEPAPIVDEIASYLDGRYVCASEAAWRIFGFHMHFRRPGVVRLEVHEEGKQRCQFRKTDNLKKVYSKSKFMRSTLMGWFERNKIDEGGRVYTYQQFPEKYVWQKKKMTWTPRDGYKSVGRMSYISPAAGELWYLRMLLTVVKGAQSYQGLRTVDDVMYGTYKEACYVLGLLESDNEWHEAIRENAQSGMRDEVWG